MNGNLEETIMPYLSVLADFREKVRSIAREHKVTPILEVSCLSFSLIRLIYYN